MKAVFQRSNVGTSGLSRKRCQSEQFVVKLVRILSMSLPVLSLFLAHDFLVVT